MCVHTYMAHSPDPSVDPVRCAQIAETCTNFNLRKLARAVSAIYDNALRPTGLRGTQFTVLVALASVETTTVTSVAATIGVDRTSLTRALQPLERDGLVESAPGEDGRERVLTLTSAGRERVNEAIGYWEQAQQRVTGALGPRRWRDLITHMRVASTLLGSEVKIFELQRIGDD
jgi:DNA-binding MarR family transcriptional regulator